MKQKLIFTLIAASLSGGAVAAEYGDKSTRGGKGVEAMQLERDAQMDAMMRAHYIRVVEAAGFEVLGSSNPETVPVSEMVLTVRPAPFAAPATGESGKGRRHGDDDDEERRYR